MNISKQKSGVIFLFVILLIIASVGTFVAMSLRVDPVEESLKSDPVIYTLWVITDDDGNALSTALMFFYPSASVVYILIFLEIRVPFTRVLIELTELMRFTRKKELMSTGRK